MAYRVELAKSNRAKCQVKLCKDNEAKIPKGSLKLGVWIETDKVQFFSWRHWGCVTQVQLFNLARALQGEWDEVDGMDEIGEENQEKVRKALEVGHIAPEDVTDILQAKIAAEQSVKAQAEAKRAEKEAEKEAKRAQKAAEKEAKRLEKEAAKEAKRLDREAQKQAKQALKRVKKEKKEEPEDPAAVKVEPDSGGEDSVLKMPVKKRNTANQAKKSQKSLKHESTDEDSKGPSKKAKRSAKTIDSDKDPTEQAIKPAKKPRKGMNKANILSATDNENHSSKPEDLQTLADVSDSKQHPTRRSTRIKARKT